MQKYCGVNTSLYSTIDADLISLLESAIVLTERGSYAKAEAILEGDLSLQRSLPVVVLARAECALKQFKVGVLHRILDEALCKPGVSHEAPEYRLMALMRAFAALSYKGDLRPALDELERSKIWLRDVEVTEYTDIQVRAGKIKCERGIGAKSDFRRIS